MSHDEAARLRALKDYRILDTGPDERFDRITALAADLFDTPIAFISLADADRQWFKSSIGLTNHEAPRGWGTCNPAIRNEPGAMLAKGLPLISFCACATLTTREGYSIGALSVIDTKPRPPLDDRTRSRLKSLAQLVVDELELARANAAAAERLNLLRLAEAMSGVGHWRYEVADGRVTWSDEVFRIHGVSRSSFEPDYERALALYAPEDRPTFETLVARAVRYQEPYTFQLHIQRPDGALRNVVAEAACELDDLGATRAIYGVFRDVTETVATLEAVQASEANYRLLADNATDIIARYRVDATFLYLSPAVKAVLGYDPVELVGLTTFDLIHSDDHARVAEQFLDYIKSGAAADAVRIEYRARRKDGSYVWLEAHPKAIFNENGHVVEFHDVVRDVTARREIEARLQESEAKYRLLTENSGDLIISMNLDGEFEYISPSVQAMLGYGSDELIGRPAGWLLHPDDEKIGRRAFMTARGGGAPGRAQYRLRHKDGRTIWVEARPTPARDPASGKVVGVTDVIADITDRKAAEDSLAASEALYRLVSDNATDLIMRTGPDGTIRYCSPSVRALGYEPGEMIGANALDFIHPDDRIGAQERKDKLYGDQAVDKPLDRRQRLRCKNGEYRWFDAAPSVVRDDQGRPVEVINIARDVTERKAAEDALAASEARYRLLADNAADLIFLSGLDGTIRYCSPSVRAQGYEPEELIGSNALEFIHPDDRDAAIQRRFELFTGVTVDTTLDRQERLRTKNGDYRWFDAAPSVVRDDEGRPVEVINILRDVTERKQMEDDLRLAKEAAEAAVEVKSSFVATMSHELRTPLTAIIGFVGLLAAKGKLGEMEADFVRRIGSASQTLLTLINDVLDFSKLEAGQLELEQIPVDLGALVEECLSLFGEQAKANGLALRAKIDPALPAVVRSDSVRLRQVLNNLVSNAIKFTQTGSVALNLGRSSDGGLRFAVTDTGKGIPADQVDKLFSRFVQADSSTTRMHGGSGLGLSICKSLVEMMGGQIGVDSEPGQGSTFWFELPLTAVETAVEQAGDIAPLRTAA